ncbi:MAG: hypothetical protein JWN03_7133 [Nocardia sp.]|uniref:iron chaperone n=1 Tax=Nocardia sp. TaxID=1821 RepID=UPI00260D9B1B|nr:DUF1801 domain-containing protein [Nocardia sp.]MCU1646858.1 hypothetical protein [Nocardia sp.]
MVRSEAADVDAYLAALPENRAPTLTRLREMCRTELEGFTELMAYGMPSYARTNEVEFAFASQQQYISIYLLRTDVRETFTEALSTHNMGKGCLRFRTPADIDFALIRNLLSANATTPGQIC